MDMKEYAQTGGEMPSGSYRTRRIAEAMET